MILKVYFIEFSSLWKTCGTRHPTGHEEEIGTYDFCLVELDPLLRISIMIHFISFIHFHKYFLHRRCYDLPVHLTGNHINNY